MDAAGAALLASRGCAIAAVGGTLAT